MGGIFSAEAGVLIGNTSWSDDRIIHTAGAAQSTMGWPDSPIGTGSPLVYRCWRGDAAACI